MKDKDLLLIYGASSQKVITFIKAMGVIVNLKERVNPATNSLKGLSKKNSYPEGKPYCCRKQLALKGKII